MSHLTQTDKVNFILDVDPRGGMGMVKIRMRGPAPNYAVEIPFYDLAHFVASVVRKQKISALEQMSDAEVLGYDPKREKDLV